MKILRPALPRLLWALTFVICAAYYGKWGREAYNFYGDALGYYMYLPATFIYHNHKSIERLPADREIRPFIHAYAAQMGNGQRTPKGYVLNQYTYGVALMEAPFFLAAHAVESIRGSPANGFSWTYRAAIALSSMVYVALGLLITYRVLRRTFSRTIASISAALLLLGTNLFWFTMQQHGMAHQPLFFLFALMMQLTIQMHEGNRLRHFAGLGLVAGLITVIRPVDGLCVLLPILYRPAGHFLTTKLSFAKQNWRGILLAGLCFTLPIIPQLLYWKWLTGYSVYDSYGPSQGFSFSHPHIWQGLFGASNGWLFYTPLMLLALAGFAAARHIKSFAGAIALLLVLYIWAVYAWYVPNYPNGLGSRPMVDIYPLLALPLAASIEWLGRQTLVLKLAGATLITLFSATSLSYAVQEVKGMLWSEDSKYAYNFSTLFHHSLKYNNLVVWDLAILQPGQAGLVAVGNATCADIRIPDLANHLTMDSLERKLVYAVQNGEEYTPLVVKADMSACMVTGARWLRCSGRFLIEKGAAYDIYKNQLLVCQIKRGGEVLKWYGLRINNKLAPASTLFSFTEGVWGNVSCFIPIPPDTRPRDTIQLDVWNISKRPFRIEAICLQAFK